jgi:uncharacterized protein (TIGR03083 family)
MAEQIPAPDELAALLALDALPADEQADAELRHGTFPAGLADVVAALAEVTATQPPQSLRGAALSRAAGRRAADRPVGAVEPSRPIDAYRQTAAEFYELLAGLHDDEWLAAAHAEHGSVRDLVAHLTGVERLCIAWLDPTAAPPVDPRVDHITATRPVVAELADLEVHALARAWHETALGVAAAAGAGDQRRPVSFHDITTSVDGLLVMRTFELWAHWMDIALATGRPMPILDAPRMALLSAQLMAALPLALAYSGQPPRPGSARFVLTGDAGGCYTVPLDFANPITGPGAPDVTIVADVVDLCRVAARRLDPAELDATVEGDAGLARAVLAGADAFARD